MNCISGEMRGKIELSASISFKNKTKLKADIIKKEFKISDWHYSDLDGFQLKKCPHYSYQVIAKVTDESGNPYPGATILGTTLAQDPVTDENGVAVFYLYDGIYLLSVENELGKITNKLVIKERAKEIEFSMKKAVYANGSCGENLTWELNRQGTLTISGTGEMDDWTIMDNLWTVRIEAPWEDYREQIQELVIQDGVKSISKNAFCGLSEIKNVKIPNSIVNIGEGAFYKCCNLEMVELGKGVKHIGGYAFEYCNIKELTVNCNTEMEYGAFNFNTIVTLNVGANVKKLNEDFYQVYGEWLENIDVNVLNMTYSSVEGVLYNKKKTILLRYPEKKEVNEYQILNGVTTIETRAFSMCENLERVGIPEGVRIIKEYAFKNCYNLKEVIIPNSTTTIGDCAFELCGNLEAVELGRGVKNIGKGAFWTCKNIKELTIDCDVEWGYGILYDSNIITLNIGANVKNLFPGDGVNYYGGLNVGNQENINVDTQNSMYSSENGILYNKEKTVLIRYPQKKVDVEYQILNGVTTIETSAFSMCENLERVGIPEGVRIIKEYAFQNCYNLKEVTIPNSTTTIGEFAFSSCSGLETITIGKGLTSIGNYAFEWCHSLKEIYYAGNEANWKELLNRNYNYCLEDIATYYNSTGSATKSAKMNVRSLQSLPEQEWEFVTETESVSEVEDAFVTEESEVTSIGENQSLPEESIESMTESEDIFVEENFAEDIVPETTPAAEGMELSYTTGVTDHSTERMNPVFMQSKSDVQIEDLSAGLDALVQSAIYYGTVT